MNLWKWLVGLFVPFEDGGAGDGENAGEGGGDTPQRPDFVPEKFWNPEKGVLLPEVFQSYNELEGKIRSKTEDLMAQVKADLKAQAPENYEFKMPDGLQIPEGIEMDLNPDDPLLQWFNGFAKENGITQEVYDSAIKQYIELEIAALPNVAEELKLLGENGADRLQKVQGTIGKMLSKDEQAAISNLMTSVHGITALEKMLSNAGPGNFDGDGGGETLTLEQLRALQATPEYYRDQNPELIAKVRAGYARLYANK